jgi:hypothetical protein
VGGPSFHVAAVGLEDAAGVLVPLARVRALAEQHQELGRFDEGR